MITLKPFNIGRIVINTRNNSFEISSSDRLEYIDLLKVIGLIGIMLAHVESPDWIIFARSFDVVLMVTLSAILCGYSYQNHIKRGGTSITWCFKRIERLIIPTWSFLALYFLIMLVIGEKYSIKYYLQSFLLTRFGIGYVWIILIYIYCALLIPIFIKYRGNIMPFKINRNPDLIDTSKPQNYDHQYIKKDL